MKIADLKNGFCGRGLVWITQRIKRRISADSTVIESPGKKITRFMINAPQETNNFPPPCCVEIETDFLHRYADCEEGRKADAERYIAETVSASLAEYRRRGPNYELRGNLTMTFDEDGLYRIL